MGIRGFAGCLVILGFLEQGQVVFLGTLVILPNSQVTPDSLVKAVIQGFVDYQGTQVSAEQERADFQGIAETQRNSLDILGIVDSVGIQDSAGCRDTAGFQASLGTVVSRGSVVILPSNQDTLATAG